MQIGKEIKQLFAFFLIFYFFIINYFGTILYIPLPSKEEKI